MPPSPSPTPGPGGEHEGNVYEGSHGELLTDMDWSTRSVEDICREVLSGSGLQTRYSDHPPPPLMGRCHRYPPTPAADDSDLRRAQEDQQTATPNPGPSRAQFLNNVPNKAFVGHKLPQAQRRADKKPNVLASKELFNTTTLEESIILPSVESSPPISARKPPDWNKQFFIRVDLAGAFHTYPQLGGPFRSLEDAEKAILCHLDEQRDPKMCTDVGLSRSEIAIRDALYWPDGTRKKSSRFSLDYIHIGLLIQALLDKYNEENNLLGDLAYQVEDVVSFRDIYEGDCYLRYYHLNFTRKTKRGAGGIDNLLFAEVFRRIRRGQAEEFELSCLQMLKPVDNGPCYGCSNDDGGMKHPSDTGKYKGGHDPSYPRCRGIDSLMDFFPGLKMDDPLIFPKDMDARLEAEEARIRYIYGSSDVAKSDLAGTHVAASAP